MIKILLTPTELLAGPPCEACGGETELYGIEPHPTRDRIELRTFVCTACEAVQTADVPRRR